MSTVEPEVGAPEGWTGADDGEGLRAHGRAGRGRAVATGSG
eukprot:COSAG02_NODE_328_length_24547_cov_4.124141_22_plen_41_part_00